MKKTVAMLSAAVFALSLAACGASSTAPADENAAAPQSGAAAALHQRLAQKAEGRGGVRGYNKERLWGSLGFPVNLTEE